MDTMLAHIPGCWNAHVAAGATREDRLARLEKCPAAFRAGVDAHVRTVFAIKARAAGKKLKGPRGVVTTAAAITQPTEQESIT